jgi:outer membrane protein assembly factor BamB
MTSECLAVVPVFVNVGAALLPAILAAAASVLSLLFRPMELWRACRSRPRTAIAVVVGAVSVSVGAVWLCAPGTAPALRRVPTGSGNAALQRAAGLGIDWAAVARDWLRQEELAAIAPAMPSAAPQPAAKPTVATIFGGGPLRNGYLGGGSPLGLRNAWEFPVAGSRAAHTLEGAMFLSSPAVVGDAVFAASCQLDLQGNVGAVVCLDATTGQLRWMTTSFKDSAGQTCELKGFFSSPAVTADGRRVVIGQGLHNDENCELLCFDARDGQLRWRLPTPLHIESSPAIEGDLTIAGAGAVEVGDDRQPKSHPGLVLAVRISTGQKVWEYQVNDPESPPVMADGAVYIGSGFHGSAVVALRTQSDEELRQQGLDRLLWRAATPHPATGAITLAGELVIVACGNGDYVYADPHPAGAVLALDRKTGRVLWQLMMADGVLGKIAVADGKAVVPVRNGEVVCLDLAPSASNRVLWRQRVHGEKAVLAGPAFTGRCVYAVTQDGQLVVLDAADGRPLERHALNATSRPGEMGLSLSSPMVALGRVFVGSETGGLRCFVGKELRP